MKIKTSLGCHIRDFELAYTTLAPWAVHKSNVE